MSSLLTQLAVSVVSMSSATDTTLADRTREAPPDVMVEARVWVAPDEALAVSAMGTGPAVVFISGQIGSSFTWRHVAPGVAAAGYRVVTIDPLGMGRSARPPHADYRLETQAERVRMALDSLQVPRAVIVAHGIAGSIALRFALAHRDRAAGLVSLEGGPSERAGSPGVKQALALAPLLKLFGGRKLIRGKIRGGLRNASGDPGWVTDAVVDRYADGPGDDAGATLRTLGRMADAVDLPALAPRLGGLDLPVTVLTGGAPHSGGPGAAELAVVQRALPHVGLVCVNGAGHYLQEERPDAVIEAVLKMAARVLR